MIKNIIFDMGNVLLSYNPQIPLDLYCRSQEAKDIIRRELFEGPEWLYFQSGPLRARKPARSKGVSQRALSLRERMGYLHDARSRSHGFL